MKRINDCACGWDRDIIQRHVTGVLRISSDLEKCKLGEVASLLAKIDFPMGINVRGDCVEVIYLTSKRRFQWVVETSSTALFNGEGESELSWTELVVMVELMNEKRYCSLFYPSMREAGHGMWGDDANYTAVSFTTMLVSVKRPICAPTCPWATLSVKETVSRVVTGIRTFGLEVLDSDFESAADESGIFITYKGKINSVFKKNCDRENKAGICFMANAIRDLHDTIALLDIEVEKIVARKEEVLSILTSQEVLHIDTGDLYESISEMELEHVRLDNERYQYGAHDSDDEVPDLMDNKEIIANPRFLVELKYGDDVISAPSYSLTWEIAPWDMKLLFTSLLSMKAQGMYEDVVNLVCEHLRFVLRSRGVHSPCSWFSKEVKGFKTDSERFCSNYNMAKVRNYSPLHCTGSVPTSQWARVLTWGYHSIHFMKVDGAQIDVFNGDFHSQDGLLYILVDKKDRNMSMRVSVEIPIVRSAGTVQVSEVIYQKLENGEWGDFGGEPEETFAEVFDDNWTIFRVDAWSLEQDINRCLIWFNFEDDEGWVGSRPCVLNARDINDYTVNFSDYSELGAVWQDRGTSMITMGAMTKSREKFIENYIW